MASAKAYAGMLDAVGFVRMLNLALEAKGDAEREAQAVDAVNDAIDALFPVFDKIKRLEKLVTLLSGPDLAVEGLAEEAYRVFMGAANLANQLAGTTATLMSEAHGTEITVNQILDAVLLATTDAQVTDTDE